MRRVAKCVSTNVPTPNSYLHCNLSTLTIQQILALSAQCSFQIIIQFNFSLTLAVIQSSISIVPEFCWHCWSINFLSPAQIRFYYFPHSRIWEKFPLDLTNCHLNLKLGWECISALSTEEYDEIYYRTEKPYFHKYSDEQHCASVDSMKNGISEYNFQLELLIMAALVFFTIREEKHRIYEKISELLLLPSCKFYQNSAMIFPWENL